MDSSKKVNDFKNLSATSSIQNTKGYNALVTFEIILIKN